MEPYQIAKLLKFAVALIIVVAIVVSKLSAARSRGQTWEDIGFTLLGSTIVLVLIVGAVAFIVLGYAKGQLWTSALLVAVAGGCILVTRRLLAKRGKQSSVTSDRGTMPSRWIWICGLIVGVYTVAFISISKHAESVCLDQPVWESGWDDRVGSMLFGQRWRPAVRRQYIGVHVTPWTLSAYCEAPEIGGMPKRLVPVAKAAEDRSKFESL